MEYLGTYKSSESLQLLSVTKHLSTDADSITAAKKLLSIFFIPPRRHCGRCRQGAFTEKKKIYPLPLCRRRRHKEALKK